MNARNKAQGARHRAQGEDIANCGLRGFKSKKSEVGGRRSEGRRQQARTEVQLASTAEY